MTSPLNERSERRRREVCDAARRVIIRQGLEATTMRDISREGGFTTGVLTHYFPDKQAVIQGAFAAASDDYHHEVNERLAAAVTPADRLVALVELAIPDGDSRQTEWRLWSELWTYAGRDPVFWAQVEKTDAIWQDESRRVFAEARAAGLVADVDVAAAAHVFVRLVDGLGLRAWLSGRWEEARRTLVHHMATLRVPEEIQQRMLDPTDSGGDG
jgi:AcrR family transcriptional regulator